MSKVYEIFGYPLESIHPDAINHRNKAYCPFMETPCDGGGNRYLSALNLQNHPELSKHFPGLETVQVGICSLLVKNKPWIVCPRRLLALGGTNRFHLQDKIREHLAKYNELKKGVVYKVWSEVKMKVATQISTDERKIFDYTFDYIIAGKQRKRLADIAVITGKSERVCERIAANQGFTMSRQDGEVWVDDFPSNPIVIVEIMTSSTSGGNKTKRTQIGMAFEDAILNGKNHDGPGINYRQVWARMVSQLIVKSQVGLAWGGKTFWVLQDVLTDYISDSTSLNLGNYRNTHADEVNILAFGYGKTPTPEKDSGVIQLTNTSFFAGPISKANTNDTDGGFIDIIKIGAAPPKAYLWKSLFQKSPCGTIRK